MIVTIVVLVVVAALIAAGWLSRPVREWILTRGGGVTSSPTRRHERD